MAWKQKRKAKSSILMTGPTTAAQGSGSSQAGPSSHGCHTSSLGQEGVSSQSIAGMEVDLCKLQETSPPIAQKIYQIRTRYKTPGTDSLTRYAFLADTTRIISVRIWAVFSLHAFFDFWPVLLLPLAINLMLFDSQYFGIHEVCTESCTTPLYGRFGTRGLNFIFGGRINQLTHSEHEYAPQLSLWSLFNLPLQNYGCVHAIVQLLVDNQCRS